MYVLIALLIWLHADNPYDTADKWLLKENLPLSYRQQIVEFILQNTGQKDFNFNPSFRDPYTGGEYVALVFSHEYGHPKFLFYLSVFIPANAYVPGEHSRTSGMLSFLGKK